MLHGEQGEEMFVGRGSQTSFGVFLRRCERIPGHDSPTIAEKCHRGQTRLEGPQERGEGKQGRAARGRGRAGEGNTLLPSLPFSST